MRLGLFVGLAVAAYTLPGVIGAVAFGRLLRGRSARAMLLGHCVLRAGCLGGIALLYATGMLAPLFYLVLLAGSSLMYAWGNAGPVHDARRARRADGRMAVNSLASAQVSFATIVGPVLAGFLLAFVGPDLLLGDRRRVVRVPRHRGLGRRCHEGRGRGRSTRSMPSPASGSSAARTCWPSPP